jgi:hypothetical protein
MEGCSGGDDDDIVGLAWKRYEVVLKVIDNDEGLEDVEHDEHFTLASRSRRR